MLFVETPTFTALIGRILSEDEYKKLQFSLLSDPIKGRLIPGGGGLRKLRWSDPKRRKGKRGGIRVIYYVEPKSRIHMIFAYDKEGTGDLTRSQLKLLREYVKEGI